MKTQQTLLRLKGFHFNSHFTSIQSRYTFFSLRTPSFSSNTLLTLENVSATAKLFHLKIISRVILALLGPLAVELNNGTKICGELHDQ